MPKQLTTEQFIERALLVHDDQYVYDKVDYTNMHRHVFVRCREHQLFKIRPRKHLEGTGCPQCKHRVTTTVSTAEFINKCVQIHQYDYSHTKYIGYNKNIQVSCPTHGMFQINARSHLQGAKCPKCCVKNKWTTESYIQSVSEIHDNKYDYSKVAYTTTKSKITIGCPNHGDFEQVAEWHQKRKAGCPKCPKKHFKYDYLKFVRKSTMVHGDKYDYSTTLYLNAHQQVHINCPKHGQFNQRPMDHWRGNGCPSCATFDKILTTEQFISKAVKIHNDNYSYGVTRYEHNDISVEIICPTHGTFKQKPNIHLAGSGCPGCAKDNRFGMYTIDVLTACNNELGDSPGVLYFIKLTSGDESFYKVGITSSIHNRMNGFKKYEVSIITILDTTLLKAFRIEQEVLAQYREDYQYYPIDRFGGYTECFSLSNEVKLDILNLINERMGELNG